MENHQVQDNIWSTEKINEDLIQSSNTQPIDSIMIFNFYHYTKNKYWTSYCISHKLNDDFRKIVRLLILKFTYYINQQINPNANFQ